MSMIDFEIFTEQAEYISTSSFEKWSISHPNERTILKKLTQGGAKLITGPRGCGKTTLMLKAYYKLCDSKADFSFPLYVNFKSSLKLEPLYRNNSNAAFWFNQWLLLKVIQGLYEATKDAGHLGYTFATSRSQIDKNISLLEMGRCDLLSDDEDLLTIQTVDLAINKAIDELARPRCVLLLDDAGHAFSPDQQHDFFEFFREIKSKSISPKAAIYPGVTSYSSSFHAGHDAEEIDVWNRPESSDYIQFMHTILKTRFNDNLYEQLSKDLNLLNLMCFAAYGIPRSLLNMIATFCKEDEDITRIRLTNASVLRAVKGSFDNTYKIYDSLKLKLPMYKNFIDAGATFYENSLTINKSFNRGGTPKRQSSIIAINRPVSSELSKVIGFFQYAGLLAPAGLSSRGGKGVYELYELHYGAIVDRNVFFSSRAINSENYCHAFQNRPNHHYPRHAEDSILGKSSMFSLALPPCEVCNSARLSGESKFCASCGNKLKDASVFENIVNQSIDNLPITEGRANSIKNSSKIRAIKDILMDHDNKELRSVHMIGPIWSKKIRSYAEEFIA